MSAILDSSIRSTILSGQDQGAVVSDTHKKVEETPQVKMTAGVVSPSYKFEDGDGLTDDYGNIYEGYGGAGGSSSITSPNGLYTTDLGDVSKFIPTDGQVLMFNNASGFWTPEDLPGGGSFSLEDLDNVEIASLESLDLLYYNGSTFKWENAPPGSLGLVVLDEAPAEGDLLKFVAGKFIPVTPAEAGLAGSEIEDYIAAFIETPAAKTYVLTYQLPYDITITATASHFGTGSGTVNFPSGTIAAGSNLSVSVSGLSGAADLSLRIDFTRDLNA